MMNVYMKNYENHTRDKRQWKVDDGKIYNIVLQHCDKVLKENMRALNKWKETKEDQDSVGILTMIQDSTHGLK